MKTGKPPIYLRLWFILIVFLCGFFGVLVTDWSIILLLATIVLLVLRLKWTFPRLLDKFNKLSKFITESDIFKRIAVLLNNSTNTPETTSKLMPPEPEQTEPHLPHNINFTKNENSLLDPSDEHEAEKASFNNELLSLKHLEIEFNPDPFVERNPSELPQFKMSNITRKTVIEKIFPLVVLDVETTGLSPFKNEIIEFSAIKYEYPFVPVSCLTTLLKPRYKIQNKITSITNISNEMVASCPSFPQILDQVNSYLAGCNLVGHNLNFDLSFLFANGVDLPEKARYYDTLQLARHTLKKSGSRQYDHHKSRYYYLSEDESDVSDYKLDTICHYYGIYRNDAHRSLSDCLATIKIFEHLIDDKTA